jgi:hypothetical protein
VEPSSCIVNTTCRDVIPLERICYYGTTCWICQFWPFLEHLLSSWVPLVGYHLWVDLDTTCRISLMSWSRHHLMKYLSLDTTWNKQTRYPFALLSCSCTLVTSHELLSWTKLICLSFQVRFEPMASFFTPLIRVMFLMLYLSLVSNPN